MARTADPAVRLALVEAAAEVLADDGLDALSIRGVANRVGTSTMAVYTHFGSKDDLVAEVVREAFTRLDAELRSVTRSEDPLVDLTRIGAAYHRNAVANPHLYRVMFGLNPLALTDPSTVQRGPVDDVALDAFGALVDGVARCVASGDLRGDPGDLALQFWATAHGAVSLELAGFLGDHGQGTFEAALASLFGGLSA